MRNSPTEKKTSASTNHSAFATLYERLSRSPSERDFMDPLRQETAGQATGVVLEVGAGNGLNFSFYAPELVEHVEAIEPDTAMLRYARERMAKARVPIVLTQAAVEDLPFADETFDSVVTTLVFCSVGDPVRGLAEMMRVMKPNATLFMAEHVRARGAIISCAQAALVPFTTRFCGNCHWNRDTARTVARVGFQIKSKRDIKGILLPMVVLQASRS